MNYLQEIKNFNDWLIINPTVTSDDISLWYALMNLNNMCGWQKEFTVAISTIVDRSRLSRSAIYRSRNKLVQLGRIKTKERSGNLCSIYQIISFVSQSGTQSETQSGTQSGTQTGTQSGTINKTKLNETKQSFSGANAPAQKKKVTEFWEGLVKTWFEFYGQKFKAEGKPAEPMFGAAQGDHLRKISAHLKKLATAKNYEWTEQYAIRCLQGFLGKAWEHDDWMRNNFELANLVSKFNSITNTSKNGKIYQRHSGKNISSTIDYTGGI